MSNTTAKTNGQGDSALQSFQLITTANVSFQRVAYLLCSAIEGGSNYWAEIKSVKKPKEFSFMLDSDLGGENPKADLVDYPFNGGSITFADSEGDMPDSVLDLEAIGKGLQVMATNHPNHWQDVLNENEDATTGDVFLQCCLYGEIVFG